MSFSNWLGNSSGFMIAIIVIIILIISKAISFMRKENEGGQE